jgi:PKD repeat protein
MRHDIDFGIVIACMACLVCLALCIPAGAAPDAKERYTVAIGDCMVTSPGEESQLVIVLSDAPGGLSDYEMSVEIRDSSVGQFAGVQFPPWASLNSRGRCPSNVLTISAADMNNKVRKGDRDILLATIAIKGKNPGSSEIFIRDISIREDTGVIVKVATIPGTVHVGDPHGTPSPPQGERDELSDSMESLPWQVPDISDHPVTATTPQTTAPTVPATIPPVTTPPVTIPPLTIPTMTRTPATIPQTRVPLTTVPATTIPLATTPPIPIAPATIPQTRVPLTTVPATTIPLATTPPTTISPTAIPSSIIPTTTPIPPTTTALPVPGSLEIHSSPGDAVVILNGNPVGRTPLVLPGVTPGIYTIVLTLDGYEDLTIDQVVVEEAARTIVTGAEACLVPLPGSVTVRSSPPGAAIHVDGEYYGTTPSSFTLMPGAYEIALDLAGYYPWRGECVLVPGETLVPDPVTLEPVPVYTVTVTAGPGGVVLPAGESFVREGESIELSFIPDPGYSVGCIYLDGAPAGFGDTLNLDWVGADHLVEVTFLEDEPEPTPPVIEADFFADPVSGTAPLAVTFRDRTVAETEVTRQWNFGDGTEGCGEREPVHIYEQAGDYAVSLTVCCGDVCDTAERAGYIRVLPPPEPVRAGFQADVTSGECPLTVTFTDTSTGDVRTREWTFGDGACSTEENPVHVYREPGVYTVSLVVTGRDTTDRTDMEGLILVGQPVIGQDQGYYRVLCTVENASVFLNGALVGHIRDGRCIIPVTGSPERRLVVVADGYMPYSGDITRCPESGEIVELHVVLVPRMPSQTPYLIRHASREEFFSNTSTQWLD